MIFLCLNSHSPLCEFGLKEIFLSSNIRQKSTAERNYYCHKGDDDKQQNQLERIVVERHTEEVSDTSVENIIEQPVSDKHNYRISA